jgi:hypothetical protein
MEGEMERVPLMGQPGHVFAMQRPSMTAAFALNSRQPRNTTYRELPPPTGESPFRLDLKDIISSDQYAKIVATKTLSFHVDGDVGGIGNAVPQQLVASGLESDLAQQTSSGSTPAFLYLAGDCVYFNGQVENYYEQFYAPYEYYGVPIFAVPGNHDGENLEGDTSLDGFLRNFCAAEPTKTPESGDAPRTAMVQPNVYWTLLTPLVNIVGLYSNVPEGGEIREPQTEWLAQELSELPKDIPIFVVLHHPPFSADDHHSGSVEMKEVIANAAEQAGRRPEVVVAGHVHNYQRFTHEIDADTSSLYLVTGAGGYHNLHAVQTVDGEKMIPPVVLTDSEGDDVTLNSYCDDHHGFLRVDLAASTLSGRYYKVPRPQDPYQKGNQLHDYFQFDLAARKYLPNTLPGSK